MDPALLLYLLVHTETHDPTTVAMRQTLQQALGPSAEVVVQTANPFPSDQAAAQLPPTARRSAVVEVTWLDSNHQRAALRMYRGDQKRWTQREMGFDQNDAELERARALGLAIATMVPEGADEGDAPKKSTPAPARAAPPSGSPNAARGPEGPLEKKASTPWRGAVDVAAMASRGLGGYGGGLGAYLGGRWFLPANLALHGGGGFRAGEIPPAQASSLTLLFAAGAAWSFWSPQTALWGGGVQTDLLLLFQQASHLAADKPTTLTESRWVPGADVRIEAWWRYSRGMALVAWTGPEFSFGTTKVVVRGVEVATLSPVRWVGSLGIRTHFLSRLPDLRKPTVLFC